MYDTLDFEHIEECISGAGGSCEFSFPEGRVRVHYRKDGYNAMTIDGSLVLLDFTNINIRNLAEESLIYRLTDLNIENIFVRV